MKDKFNFSSKKSDEERLIDLQTQERDWRREVEMKS